MKKLLIVMTLLFASSTSAQYPTTSFTAGGNITAASASCLATNCVPIKLPASATTLTVGVTGTFSATLAVEESQDGGRTWTSAGSNITGAGTTSFTITAFSDFRVRASAYVSGNAGINILVSASTNSGGSGVSSLNSLSGAVTIAAGTNVTLTPSGNTITIASTGGGGAVSSVSNSDGSLAISPTTGTVVASLNPANANTWTALQTFGTNISIGGVTPTGATGTGNAVFSSSPTLTTPALGTPSALVLTNATGLPFSAITSGTNSVAAMLCNTGCSIGTSGSGTVAATSISNTTVTPGNYTSTNLTVGADGRITAASNGGLTTPSSLNILNFGAFWNSKSINTATFTNGSPNVSTTATGTFQCPGSAFPCSSGGDVGKSAYGYGVCNTGGIPSGQGTALPFGTIVTVTDAQHIVMSVNATSTPTAGHACFYWGNPDDAAQTAMDAAAVASNICPTETLPSGGGMFTQAHFIVAIPACETTGIGTGGSLNGWGEVISGQGKGGTTVFIAPTLASTNSAGCTGGATGIACFGGQQGQLFKDFSFDGGGDYATGFPSAKNVIEFGSYSTAEDWAWINYGASDSNATFFLNGLGAVDFRGVTLVGMPPLNATTGVYNFVNSAIQEGCQIHMFNVTASVTVNFSNGYISLGPCGITNQAGFFVQGQLNITNTLLFVEANPLQLTLINVQGTGIVKLSQDTFAGGATLGLPVNLGVSGAKMYASQTSFNAGTTQTISVFGVAGTQFIDLGGNSANKSFSGVPIYGSASITGSPLVTGNVVLTSGWGSGAAASAFSGNSQTAQWTSTIGTTPSTTAVTTVTFPTPFFSAPTCTAIINGGTSTAVLQASCSATATAATITYLGTLVSGTVITTLRASN